MRARRGRARAHRPAAVSQLGDGRLRGRLRRRLRSAGNASARRRVGGGTPCELAAFPRQRDANRHRRGRARGRRCGRAQGAGRARRGRRHGARARKGRGAHPRAGPRRARTARSSSLPERRSATRRSQPWPPPEFPRCRARGGRASPFSRRGRSCVLPAPSSTRGSSTSRTARSSPPVSRPRVRCRDSSTSSPTIATRSSPLSGKPTGTCS